MSAPPPGWLVRQLPVAMLQDDFLVRFASIFEEVAGTLVHSVDTIGVAADLSLTPEEFVPWLGRWIGAPADPQDSLLAGPGAAGSRQRDWVRAQARVLSARGTRTGLQEVLRELAGGHPVEVVDGGGVYREGRCPEGDTGWVRVRMPLPGPADPQDVLDLIRAEVPIGVEAELVVLPDPDGPFVPSARQPEPQVAYGEEDAAWDAVAGRIWDGQPEDIYAQLAEIPFPETISTNPAPELSGAVHRLPGTGGRAGRPARICPRCAEHIETGVDECRRCGSPMRIVPAEPVPEPERVVAFPEPEIWLPERRIWPLIVSAVVAALLLGALLVAVLT